MFLYLDQYHFAYYSIYEVYDHFCMSMKVIYVAGIVAYGFIIDYC
jgi:hypothetical protein